MAAILHAGFATVVSIVAGMDFAMSATPAVRPQRLSDLTSEHVFAAAVI